MSIFSKLFRKGQPKVEAEAPEDVFEDTFIDETEAGTYETDEDRPLTYVPVEDVDVDINYRGGLLSPTQKPKDEQYQEILDNITEETIAVIDKALKEEVELYDVFRRIEEQDISLLTLVALDMTSEEDIAAYQLKQQRQYEDTGLVEDAEYAHEVAQSQRAQPNVQFQIDSEELDQLETKNDTPFETATSPSPFAHLFDTPSEEQPAPTTTEVFADVPPVDGSSIGAADMFDMPRMTKAPPPVTTTVSPTVDSMFSGSIYGNPAETTETDTPSEVQPSPVFPKSSASTNKMMDALMHVEKPVEPTPVSLPAARFMADMQPVDEPTPVEESVVEPHPVIEPVVEPAPVADITIDSVVEPVKELPQVPSFLESMEEVVDVVKPTEPTDTQSEDLQEKAGTFAGVKMEFEGYEEKPTAEEDSKPHDVLDGLRALFGATSTGGSRNRPPRVIAPSLSDEKVEEKAQHIQKYTRKNAIKDTRIYILWDGLTLPVLEGYQFHTVKTLRDLSSFGLDVNDLLIVTSQIPNGFVDSIDAFLHNIREEHQPYRIVNFTKKPYDTPYITDSLNALTKEALDTYFENNPIVLDKKNQVSGFGGIADFLTNKGRANR